MSKRLRIYLLLIAMFAVPGAIVFGISALGISSQPLKTVVSVVLVVMVIVFVSWILAQIDKLRRN